MVKSGGKTSVKNVLKAYTDNTFFTKKAWNSTNLLQHMRRTHHLVSSLIYMQCKNIEPSPEDLSEWLHTCDTGIIKSDIIDAFCY